MEENSNVKYAGFFSRLAVFLVDLFIVSAILSTIDRYLISLAPLTVWVTIWLYWAVSISRWKTTPGGKLLGIEVVNSSGASLSFGKASLRFFLSVAPFALYLVWRGMQHEAVPAPALMVQMLPQLLYLLPPFVMFFTKRRQMIHDLVVGSVVVDVSAQTRQKGTKSRKIVSVSQKVLRLAVVAVFLVTFGYVFMYMSVFLTLGLHHERAYNNSFHTHYKVNDRNNTTIRFYNKELEKASKAFVEATGMHEIFEADVKRDLALNCIEYLLRADYNASDWIDEGSRFRKNARNKYADTEEKIAKAKANEDYLGRHFYEYDLNEVNRIEDQIVNPFADKSPGMNILCREHQPVDTMFHTFIYHYIANREEALDRYIGEEKSAKPSGVLNKTFYREEISKLKAWLQILYRKYPDYQAYRKTQHQIKAEKKRLRNKREDEKQRKRKEKAIWNSAQRNAMYPTGYFKGVNLDIRNHEGLTPLMVAAEKGHDAAIHMWAMDGAVGDLSIKDSQGKTVWDHIKKPENRREKIFSDRMYGTLRQFEIYQIIKNKAKIVASSYRNDTDMLKITIEGAGCDTFVFPERTQCTENEPIIRDETPQKQYESDVRRGVPPIFVAIQNHLYKKLVELLDAGADIEKKNKFGTRPLSFAIYHNDIKIVRILLEYGANPNVIDGNGLYTPLSEAGMKNNLETAKLLLEYGADINFQVNKSETALTVAAKGCKNFQAVKLLLDHGADPTRMDLFGYNTLTGLKRYCRDENAYRKMKSLIGKNSL